jgi:hypothetical protein
MPAHLIVIIIVTDDNDIILTVLLAVLLPALLLLLCFVCLLLLGHLASTWGRVCIASFLQGKTCSVHSSSGHNQGSMADG